MQVQNYFGREVKKRESRELMGPGFGWEGIHKGHHSYLRREK
jgi:hypothetical protein